jgi:hypothetical protein
MIGRTACSFVVMFVVAACAMGGPPTGTPNDQHPDANHQHDSHVPPPPDAKLPDAHLVDAKVFHDAAAMPDASGGGGFCMANHDCTDPTTCCWVAVCVPGNRLGDNLCFPH